MTEQMMLDYFSQAIYTIMITSAPMLIAALVVGLAVAIFQATTQIQEQTLAFVPKIIAIFLVLIVIGPWILTTVINFTYKIFDAIATIR